MNPGIVICSRSDSTRVPSKPWRTIKGKYLLAHLLDQLKGLIPDIVRNIVIAVPHPEIGIYTERLRAEYPDLNFINGFDFNPLGRTLFAAETYDIDPVIRITHDKIFIDRFALEDALDLYKFGGIDYLYSSHLAEGSGFEIISWSTLNKAYKGFPNQNIEHISYAMKIFATNIHNYTPPTGRSEKIANSGSRFLIDFEEDLDFIRSVFEYSDTACPSLENAIETVAKFPHLKKINCQPELTVYTCAHNDVDYIQWCMESVLNQTIFDRIEYIIIDDHSTDGTHRKILSSKYLKRIKLKRNETNIGLSSSCNVALNLARGKYIMRLDADDMLLFPFILEKMLRKMKHDNLEALYPTYIDQKTMSYTKGEDNHHVGGCLFLTKAIRNIQFAENLRGFEGLDLFERAKDHIKIGYYDDLPAFFYRDKPNSMSKINLGAREEIKNNIKKNGFWLSPDVGGVPV